MGRISDNKFILLKFFSFKKFTAKTCLSDVDEANSIRDYFFCQQLISHDHFCASYVTKKSNEKYDVILGGLFVVKNANFRNTFSAESITKNSLSRVSLYAQ